MRRFVSFLVLVLLLAAGGGAGAWYFIAQRIEAGVAVWAAERRAEGLSVEYLTAKVDGFPWEWRLTVALPAMSSPGPTQWEWQGESVVARIRPWQPRDVPLLFPGVHVFEFGPEKAARRMAVAAAKPDGRAVIDALGRLSLLTLDLGTVRLRYATDDTPPTELGRLQLTVQPKPAAPGTRETDRIDVAMIVDDAVLPRAPLAGLGQRIVRAETDLSFKGKLPPGKLTDAVVAWRDDGGVIEFNRAGVNWGPLDLQGTGTLTLDELNRPLGAFTMRARGIYRDDRRGRRRRGVAPARWDEPQIRAQPARAPIARATAPAARRRRLGAGRTAVRGGIPGDAAGAGEVRVVTPRQRRVILILRQAQDEDQTDGSPSEPINAKSHPPETSS